VRVKNILKATKAVLIATLASPETTTKVATSPTLAAKSSPLAVANTESNNISRSNDNNKIKSIISSDNNNNNKNYNYNN
jgi:hypothetical protein